MLPIFDSLTHPTLDGISHRGKPEASFESLRNSLRENNFMGACAVGLDGIASYNHTTFMQKCREYPELVPIAAFNPMRQQEIDIIEKLGYRGIKIHLRRSQAKLDAELLGKCFQLASHRNLTVFYCSYMHGPILTYPNEDPFFVLVKALKMAPGAKVIIMHGGDIQLLRYAELLRSNDNLLLDLSFTLMKYAGSSIDQDISFLLQNMDQRICLGTDHPDYDHQSVRQRFEQLGKHVTLEKLENVACKNILNFLNLHP